MPKKSMKQDVINDIRAILTAPNNEEALRLLSMAVKKYESSAPDLARWMEENVHLALLESAINLFLLYFFSVISANTMIVVTDNKKKNVVLVEYPRKGSWAVGFATRENSGEISDKLKKKLINVFVPTTPNPTSGFLLMYPKEDVIYLDLTFEEASKFIVSAGTSNPS